jgi:hypothetical protein
MRTAALAQQQEEQRSRSASWPSRQSSQPAPLQQWPVGVGLLAAPYEGAVAFYGKGQGWWCRRGRWSQVSATRWSGATPLYTPRAIGPCVSSPSTAAAVACRAGLFERSPYPFPLSRCCCTSPGLGSASFFNAPPTILFWGVFLGTGGGGRGRTDGQRAGTMCGRHPPLGLAFGSRAS